MVKETITPELILKAEKLLKDVSPETNLIEILGANGLKLVRMNSEEFKKRENDPMIMFFELPASKDFFISTE
jgi:hypothetical protein